MKKNKILILANNDLGLYNFRKELVQELLNKNFLIYISAPFGEKITYFENIGCVFLNTDIERRGKNPFKDISLIFQYGKIIKKIKPNIILTYTIKPNIYGGIVARFNKIHYIVNITGLGSAVMQPGFLQKITLLLYKFSLKNVNCIFFQNEANLNFFKNIGLNSKKNRLIPGSGVNLDKYHLLEYPNDKNIEFIYISRIMKEKGIEEYLKAAEFVKNKYPNTIFHILGYCEENYIELINDYERKNIVKYHGLQTNIIPYLKEIHCTIHPTYYPEGMSNVVLESAASGRPVITTNRAGCREAVEDGVTGFLFEEKNTQELISKIERFISMTNAKKRMMGLNGRLKVEKEFNREIVIKAYIEELNKIINKDLSH